MTTVRELVRDALIEIGVADSSNEPASEMSEHARRCLNRVLGKWSQRKLLRPTTYTVTVPLAGAASYTIGPSGAIVATRPIAVDAATYTTTDGAETPIERLTAAEWFAEVRDKAVTGAPDAVFYSATDANGTLYVTPIGNSGSVRLLCRAVIASYASLNDSITLPDGYEEALMLATAEAVSSSYEKAVAPDLLRRLTAATRAIKTANHEPVLMDTTADLAYGFDIERGY